MGGATEIEMVTLFLSRLVERWRCCSSVKPKYRRVKLTPLMSFVHDLMLLCAERISMPHLGAGLWDWAERFCAAPPDMVVGYKDETRCVAGAMGPDSEATACSLYPGSTPLRWERDKPHYISNDDSGIKQTTTGWPIKFFLSCFKLFWGSVLNWTYTVCVFTYEELITFCLYNYRIKGKAFIVYVQHSIVCSSLTCLTETDLADQNLHQ